MKFKNGKAFSLAVLLVLIIVNVGYNQVTYSPLKSVGSIPKDFLQSSAEKIRRDISEEYKRTHVPILKSKRYFYEFSNFLIDDLLLSGNILFGDTVTNYVRSVAAKLFKDDPYLLNNIRIYTVKSSAVNAFTTNSGIIFVTHGLLSFIENESQLAFILAHEAIHFKNKHVIDNFNETTKIFDKNGDYKYKSLEEKFYLAGRYSRKLEMEADSLGFLLFAKSEYDTDVVVPQLESMKFNKSSYQNDNFIDTFLNSEYFKVPSSFYEYRNSSTVKIDSITKLIEFDSHPTFDLRIEQINRLIKSLGVTQTAPKRRTSKEFEYIQLLVRMEYVRILIAEVKYSQAIYESFMLSKVYPEVEYFKLTILKALYGITKFIDQGQYLVISNTSNMGSFTFQRFENMISQLTGHQIFLLTARYMYLNTQNSENEFVIKLRDEIFIDLVNKYHMDFSFYRAENDSLKLEYEKYKLKREEIVILTNKTAAELKRYKDSILNDVNEPKFDSIIKTRIASKTDTVTSFKSNSFTINTTKKKDNTAEDKYGIGLLDKSNFNVFKPMNYKTELELFEEKNVSSHFRLIFSEMWDDENFNKYVDSISIIAADYKIQNSDNGSIDFLLSSHEIITKTTGRNIRLGIDTIIVASPFFYKIDKHRNLDVEESENSQNIFSEYLRKSAKYFKLNSTIYNSKGFKESDIENYNDHASLNQWLNERLSIDKVKMISLESEYVSSLMDKTGTSLVLFSGCIKYHTPNEFANTLLKSVFFSPIGLLCLLMNTNWIFYTNAVFDLKTGKCYLMTEDLFRANKKNLDIRINNTFKQIKYKSK